MSPALSKSFKEHALRIKSRGSCQIEMLNKKGVYVWVSTADNANVREAYVRCMRKSYEYGI